MARRDYVNRCVIMTGRHPQMSIAREPWRFPLETAAALLVLLLGPACSTPAGDSWGQPTLDTVRGQVIDRDTGLPLADVHVLALYEHDNGMLGHSEDVCIDVAYTLTIADGYYGFAKDRYGSPLVIFYKTGYTLARSPHYVTERLEPIDGKAQVRSVAVETYLKTGKVLREEIFPTRAEAERAAGAGDRYLSRFSGDKATRMKQLQGYVTTASCPQAGAQLKKEAPYLNAIYFEFAGLAVTRDELERLRVFRSYVEDAENAK